MPLFRWGRRAGRPIPRRAAGLTIAIRSFAAPAREEEEATSRAVVFDWNLTRRGPPHQICPRVTEVARRIRPLAALRDQLASCHPGEGRGTEMLISYADDAGDAGLLPSGR
jgi:hypothetical protein